MLNMSPTIHEKQNGIAGRPHPDKSHFPETGSLPIPTYRNPFIAS
jgi:hypothetical protein